jgi:NitT/TauT family transport system ATP-binding protein
MVSSETATRTGAVIVQAESVTKTFTTPDGHALPVLEGVSFTLSEGEIVALLGKSGSGKSTLLRCVAELIPPSSGSVSYRGTPLTRGQSGGGDGLPDLRAAAVAHRPAERRARP